MVSWGFKPVGRINKAFDSRHSEMAAILFYGEKCHNIPATQLCIFEKESVGREHLVYKAVWTPFVGNEL